MIPLEDPSLGCIAIYDSGLGGLSVLRAISEYLPHEKLLYYADSYYAPYGDRDPVWIKRRVNEVTDYCLAQGAKAVVVACNTATAVAIESLRLRLDVPVVAIEPGIKVAVFQAEANRIGVIGTTATLSSDRYKRLVDRYAKDSVVISQSCPGLVECVESRALDGDDTNELLHTFLNGMKRENVASLVLGCTHYSFLRQSIENIMGKKVTIIDPVEAVAKQLGRVLVARNLLNSGGAVFFQKTETIDVVTTGDVAIAEQFIASQLSGLGVQKIKYTELIPS